ncbi:MAG: hypothetical protein QF864_05990 [SAR202 cluster bacterium]|nr:hypothetical protein [SAR202 cluster bacterium]
MTSTRAYLVEDVLIKITRNELSIDITDMVIYLFSDFKEMRWGQILCKNK